MEKRPNDNEQAVVPAKRARQDLVLAGPAADGKGRAIIQAVIKGV